MQRSSEGGAEYMRIHLSVFIYLPLSENRLYLSRSISATFINTELYPSIYPSIHLSAYLSIFAYVHLHLPVPEEPAKPVSGSGASGARRLSCPVSGRNAGAAQARRRRRAGGAGAERRRGGAATASGDTSETIKETTRELNEILVFNSISRSSLFIYDNCSNMSKAPNT